MNLKKNLIAVSVLAATTTLVGCSDSDDGDSSLSDKTTPSSSVTAQGRITGFGSIFVSGVQYDTTGASFTVDGESASEDDLELGMMVTVSGTSAGTAGVASSVHFDDDLDGIVTAVNLDQKGVGTVSVMGYEVTVDANTLVEFYTNQINTLTQAIYDPNVGIQFIAEVSGYSDGLGNIHASRIEIKAFNPLTDYIEIKGYVNNLDTNMNTFMVADMNIVYSNATVYDDMTSAMLADGLHVEVKGRGFDGQGRLLADIIEDETNSGLLSADSDDDIEIEGVIGSVNTESFTINGVTIYYDQNTLGTKLLVENAIVEVDAYRDNQSRLFADEIEPDELDDDYHNGLELKGLVQNYDLQNNTIEVMDTTFQLTTSTMIRDEYTNIRYFSLGDITRSSGNHYVEVKAYLDDNGELIASKILYEGISNNETDELEGPLSMNQGGANVMGIPVDFGSFATPAAGMRVEMEGAYSGGVFTATSLEAEPIDSASSDTNSNS